MPLMGSLWVGYSGLSVSQNAINTTSHNITNADTKGYTRELVNQSTKSYNTISKGASYISWQQIGNGVNYALTRQIRDVFLDQSYRRESGRSAFYEVSTNTMEEVEDILGEMDGAEFKESMENLWTAVQELAKQPSGSTNQSLIVTRCAEFLEHANAVYTSMEEYQDQLNNEVTGHINRINEIGYEIKKLNNQILKVEAGGIEHANDLRDSRNYLLDELASLTNITYSENFDGVVNIQIEGKDFLKADVVYELDVQENETGFFIPYWKGLSRQREDGTVDISGAEVFNLDREISSDLNTDIGKLKAILLARGDARATWKDIPSAPQEPKAEDYVGGKNAKAYLLAYENYEKNGGIRPKAEDYDGGENAKAFREAGFQYLQDCRQYDQDVEYYNQHIAQSICMNVMAEFDSLVHHVTEQINAILEEGADTTTGYLCTGSGTQEDPYKPYQMFQLVAEEEGYTTKNLIINPDLMKSPSLLKFITKDGKEDFTTTEALKAIFTDQSYVLNPNVATKVTLNGFYNSLVSQVANSGSVYESIHASEVSTLNSITEARQSVSGVSTDEELQYLVTYQNAYNASSRYINVLDEMLEHLLNALAT